MCISPINIPDENKVQRKFYCGVCPQCVKRRQMQWAFRLKQEQKVSLGSKFITCTYDDDHLTITEDGPTLVYGNHQAFMKRLRKANSEYNQKTGLENRPLRYYAVGEYGEKDQRPHFHYLLFNLQVSMSTLPVIQEIWQNGIVDIRPVITPRINYVVGYFQKQMHLKHNDRRLPTKPFMSRGLGDAYLTPATINYHRQHMDPFIKTHGNQRVPMPRFYKDKIFNYDELAEVNQKAQDFIDELDPQTDYEIVKSEEYKRALVKIDQRRALLRKTQI